MQASLQQRTRATHLQPSLEKPIAALPLVFGAAGLTFNPAHRIINLGIVYAQTAVSRRPFGLRPSDAQSGGVAQMVRATDS